MFGNGHVIPSTPIAVDMWNIKNYPQARVFFLSHFHSDHIVGLNNSWQYAIYTSPVTAKFLIHKLKIKPSLVRSLEIGEDHLIPLDSDNQEMLTVTLFDANHCPGSVMFLFSGYFGDILYTGDFRYTPSMFNDFSLPPIDALYLDNTYCSPKCVFPTREDAIENILSQLATCLVQSKRVFIGLDNLGKEELLQKIAKERQCKIHVYPARKEIMDILGMSDIITTDKSSTNIFVVPTNQINGKNITNWNKETKTHAILATARYSGYNFIPFSKFKDIHVVKFSNHSSYLELKEFVRKVQPRTIIPVVGKDAKGIFGTDISERADMNVFCQFLRSCGPLPEQVIPESVKRTMNASEMQHAGALPSKKRKIAYRQKRVWRRPATVGVRYIVSEDSETDSDPDAVNIEATKSSNESISEFSSPCNSADEDSAESDTVWEVTHINEKGNRSQFYVKS